MPYLEVYYQEDNIRCVYWQSKNGYFYRQYENEKKPKRISESLYMSMYEIYYDL